MTQQDMHAKARAAMSEAIGEEIPPGIDAWLNAFKKMQRDPPNLTGHRPVVHCGSIGSHIECQCGSWKSGTHEEWVLAGDEFLETHIHPIVLPERAD